MASAAFEKKSIWKWKDLINMLFLVLIVVPIFIEYHLFNWFRQLFQNELYAGTSIGLIMSIIFMAGIYLLILKPNNQSWSAVGVQLFPVKQWKLIIGWTLILIAGSAALMTAMSFWGIGAENSKTESLQADITIWSFLIAFVSAAIISPIYEEIFYRGFLYRFFSSRYGISAGMVISSIIFTVVHIPTFNTLPVNFVSGLIFAWVYQKTGSVIPSIIIHGLFNGIAVILTSIA